MKILYVVSHPDLDPEKDTGYGRHIRMTISGLRDLGHEVSTCFAHVSTSSQEAASPEHSSKARNILKSLLPNFIWQSIRDFLRLRQDAEFSSLVLRKVVEFNPDVVYERASYLSVAVSRIANKMSKPHFVETNAPLVEEQRELSGASILNRLGRSREKELYQHAAAVFPVTKALGLFIENELRVNARILPNHNGVDPAIAMEKRFHASEGAKTVVGFVGSIMPYHRVDLLLEVQSILEARFPGKYALHIVGDGAQLEELVDRSKQLKIQDSVWFFGSVPKTEVFGRIAEMDICILPSTKWYCSPIKLFEYGLMAKAVVAADEPSVREIIDPEIDGLLVSDQDGMYNAIVRLGTDQDQRKSMGEKIQEKVISNFTWAENAKRIDVAINEFFEGVTSEET